MIRNDREYRITKARADEFERSLSQLRASGPSADHPMIRKAQEDSLKSQLESLVFELTEYDSLRDGSRSALQLSSLDEVPKALIMGRIAAGLTQKALAKQLDVSEQQIQRYEATNYESASLARVIEVAKALKLEFSESVFLATADLSRKSLTKRLSDAGVDRTLSDRLLFENEGDAPIDVLRAAGRAQRVFGWPTSELLIGTQKLRPADGAASALFKVYSGADESRTSALAAYGSYIARLSIEASPDLKSLPIPRNAKLFRKMVLEKHDSVELEPVLNTLWALGVVVIPLRERGGFHGACWRHAGRNAIVLKQSTTSIDRWLHDLLHEAFHAGLEPERAELLIIDEDLMPLQRRKSPEEQKASKFAGDVVLDGAAETLASQCVSQAGKSVERLKKVVPRIAQQNGVSTGALANYMAWRLSLQDIDWWGAAENLQTVESDPWQTVRDFLLTRLEWSRLDATERDVLMRALSE